MSIDNKVNGPSKIGGFLKGAFYTLSLFAILNSVTLKATKAQGDPEWKTVTTQTQLIKSDSSLFEDDEAFVDIDGNDISDSTNSYFIVGGEVSPSGYIELTFDILTRMPAPNSVDDYFTSVPEGFRIGAFPNPYNPTTNFIFEVPKSGSYDVNLYNVLGQELAGWDNSKFLSEGEYSITLGGGAGGVQFARVSGEGYSKVWKLINLGGTSIAYVDEGYNLSNYFGASKSTLQKESETEDATGEIVSDSIAIQWVVPGFGVGGEFHNLFENGEFRDTIYQEFLLPYPSSAPGMKVDPEGKRTLDVDQSYFQTDPEVNFQYKNNAKKD